MTPPIQQRRDRFALKLQEHVPGGTIRRTARVLDPDDPERGRRNLNRWLKAKTLPSARSRVALAKALGLPAEHFLDAEDEEEEALDMAARLHEMARQSAQMSRDLSELLKAVKS